MPNKVGRPKLPLEEPFTKKQWKYITLRGERNFTNEQMAEEIGVCRNTVVVWNGHRPFQEAVETKWLATERANNALAQIVKNRVLVELERRTRGAQLENLKWWSLNALTETIKALRKELEGGTSFSFAFDLGGLTPGRAADIHRREAKEIKHLQSLEDESDDIGSYIDQVAGDRPVPATAPPGETG
ncbi:MAG: hypothetical protein V3W37_03105 [Candidatus Binatia bacterium]